MSLVVGQIIDGKVAGITNFGAFIELSSGQTGLVHISEVADKYVKDVNDFLKQGDLVKVKVLTLDKGKIGLSIRQAQPNFEENSNNNYNNTRNNNNNNSNRQSKQPSFEDKLSKFLKDSDERQSALKKNVESKRGGRGGGSRVTSI